MKVRFHLIIKNQNILLSSFRHSSNRLIFFFCFFGNLQLSNSLKLHQCTYRPHLNNPLDPKRGKITFSNILLIAIPNRAPETIIIPKDIIN